MRKYFGYWRESKWRKRIWGGMVVLVLVLCLAGWKGNAQQHTTRTLQDVFRQARREAASKGGSRLLTIMLGGEKAYRYRAEYSAAELTDEQFARLQGKSSSWVEQKAKVTEYVRDIVQGSCGTGMYTTKTWEDVRIYQMGDRSRYYLLIEDRGEGKEYVARLKNCCNESDDDCTMGDILRDFIGIRGEEDISRVTLEDTEEIKEGESHILAVFTREQEKKELYQHLSNILYCGDTEDEIILSFWNEEPTEEEMKEIKARAYYIELENQQGETVFIKYQPTEWVDYLLINDEDYAIRVPDEERIFWWQLFQAAARPGYEQPGFEISVNYDNATIAKPMIYLYPEKSMDVHVEVENIEFTTLYPEYGRGWNVRAEPDGTLYLYRKNGKRLERGRKYYGLYYEGYSRWQPEWKNGFTVEKKDYQSFLEEKLRILGLSDREAEEFIVYWLPQMEKYPAVDVHFIEQSMLDTKIPLRITPKPDTLIRVLMQWRKHTDGENLPEQRLFPVARKGFTGVEWGGSEIMKKDDSGKEPHSIIDKE